jgi:hypothetical protein
MAKARQRQERRSVSYLIAAAVLVLGLGVVGYFLWPEDPPQLTLAAYDAVAAPGENVPLRARVETDSKERSPKLSGLELWFQVSADKRAETQESDSDGAAALDWKSPPSESKPTEFMVRHQQKDQPRKGLRDQARAFVWLATAKVLLVDVDHALTEGVDSLASGGNTAPTLRPGAAAALRSLSGAYKIVYLTSAARGPAGYKKLRGWIQPGAAGVHEPLPDGPLLGPSLPLQEGDEANFVAGQIETLRKSFTGSAVGVTGRIDFAKLFFDAGWKAVVVGADQAPAGATLVAEWAELLKQLAP